MDERNLTQTSGNDSETSGSIDTPLAQRRSRPVRRPTFDQNIRDGKIGGLVVPPPLDPNRPTRKQALERREREQAETEEVYFLYSANRIKIGTSNYPLRRIMEGISPYLVTSHMIVGTVPGGVILERRMHERFDFCRDHDEWFFLDPLLRDFLCEDARRADRLAAAEASYRKWLHEELHNMETKYADVRDSDADENARPDSGSQSDSVVDREPRAPQGG